AGVPRGGARRRGGARGCGGRPAARLVTAAAAREVAPPPAVASDVAERLTRVATACGAIARALAGKPAAWPGELSHLEISAPARGAAGPTVGAMGRTPEEEGHARPRAEGRG